MAEPLLVLVAAVAGAAAVVVFAANPRRASNAWFAAFMLLIGGNFACGAVAALHPYGSAQDVAWNRAAFTLLILDPVALLMFVGVFPRRNRLARAGVVAALLAAAAALMVLNWTGRIGLGYGFTLPRLLLFGYMAAAYAASLATLLVVASRETSPVWRLQANALAAGLGASLLPRFGIIPVELGLAEVETARAWLLGSAVVAVLAASLYGAALALGAQRRGLRLPFLLAAGLASPFVIGWLLAAVAYGLGNGSGRLEDLLASKQYSLRWVVFALVVGVAILRFQVVRFDDRVAVPLSYALPLALVGCAAALGHAVGAELAPSLLGFSGGQLGVLAALTAGTVGALRWQPRLARLLRLPGEGRLDLYRRVLVETLRDPTPEREALLHEMRRVCGVSAQADALLRRSLREGLAELLPGVLLAGRYRVLRPAGDGAGGTVWMAADERIGRPVALKPVERAAAAGELAALARLQHPGIVRLYDVVESAAGPVLVTEWADGGTLRGDPACRGDPRRVARLGAEILRALESVHAAGLVHGDLKPDNVLVTPSGAKIADFGAARSAPAATQAVQLAMQGSPRYLPPEALLDGACGPQNDLWATALLLLELAAGPQAVRDPARALRALGRTAPGLADALARALLEDPVARFPDAAAFRRRLERAYPR